MSCNPDATYCVDIARPPLVSLVVPILEVRQRLFFEILMFNFFWWWLNFNIKKNGRLEQPMEVLHPKLHVLCIYCKTSIGCSSRPILKERQRLFFEVFIFNFF